jgi:hypothetical protein
MDCEPRDGEPDDGVQAEMEESLERDSIEDAIDDLERAVNGQAVVPAGNGGEVPPRPSTSSAILSSRTKTLQMPNLHGGICCTDLSIGSFYSSRDKRVEGAHLVSNFARSQNISASFNADTLECKACDGHNILEGGTGVPTFVLSDQCFPPILPASSGSCLRIIRIENGFLGELALLLIDLVREKGLPKGTVIALSSPTQLATYGLAGYVEELVRTSRLLQERLGGGVVVIPAPPVFLDGIQNPPLVRALFELGAWIDGLSPENAPSLSFKALTTVILNNGVGTQPCPQLRYRLPVSLMSFEKKCWDSSGWDSVPATVAPMDSASEQMVLETFIGELNKDFPGNLDPRPSLVRDASFAAVPTSSIIVVGASLARRMADALRNESSRPVTYIQMPPWRVTAGTALAASEKLAEELKGKPASTTVILQFLDGAAFYGEPEEGGLLPMRRDGSNHFHVDGRLTVAPVECFGKSVEVSSPLLAAARAFNAVLLSPLPRYWLGRCCDDKEHVSNLEEEDHERVLIAGIDRLRRTAKDKIHCLNLAGITVMSCLQLMGETSGSAHTSEAILQSVKGRWGPDPVHPAPELFSVAAKAILAAGSFKRKREDTGAQNKRGRWSDDVSRGAPGTSRGRGAMRGGCGGHSNNRGRWHRR